MRYFHYCLLILVIAAAAAPAQNMKVEMSPIPRTEVDWNVQLTIDLPVSRLDGVAILFPEKFAMVPVAVQLNDRNLYLQNLLSVPEPPGVVAWQRVPEGLMMLFSPDISATGARLLIKGIGTLSGKPGEESLIQVKEIRAQPEGLKVSNSIIAGAALPPLK